MTSYLCNKAHLQQRVQPFNNSDEVKIHLIQGQFTDGWRKLQKDMPDVRTSPLFVFIDPFGAKGVPFQSVSEILNGGCAEVLINLDADGIVRNYLASKTEAHEFLLNEVFGDDSWRSLRKDVSFAQQCQQVLELYKTKVRSRARYVFSFEMRTSEKSLNYYLVFAGQHPRGLEKMKDAMKKIDQDGSFRFSDTSIGQTVMFRSDDPEVYAKRMYSDFAGKSATYVLLRDCALNETPFVNPKSMLAILEKSGRVLVEATEIRKRGTFNENKIKTIRFV